MARRGAYPKGVAKREEILAAALKVVASNGYRKASVREIADAVGLSPAGLLHYFGSKEELFIAVLEARDKGDEHQYADSDVTQTFLAVMRHNTTVPGLVELYAQMAAEAADPEHPARAFFQTRTERFESLVRSTVVAAQLAGELRADLDPDWIMRSLHALADGLQTAWILNSDIDMVADIEVFLALLRPPQVPPTTSPGQ